MEKERIWIRKKVHLKSDRFRPPDPQSQLWKPIHSLPELWTWRCIHGCLTSNASDPIALLPVTTRRLRFRALDINVKRSLDGCWQQWECLVISQRLPYLKLPLDCMAICEPIYFCRARPILFVYEGGRKKKKSCRWLVYVWNGGWDGAHVTRYWQITAFGSVSVAPCQLMKNPA